MLISACTAPTSFSSRSTSLHLFDLPLDFDLPLFLEAAAAGCGGLAGGGVACVTAILVSLQAVRSGEGQHVKLGIGRSAGTGVGASDSFV